MNLFKRYQPQTLEWWLEIATRGLGPQAKKRIRTEIGAHFSEGVSAYVLSGLVRQEAETKALAELGNPEAAAESLRRSHLTEWQERILRQTLFWVGRPFLLFVYFLLFFVFFVPALARPDFHLSPICAGLYLTLEFIVVLAIPTAAFLIARRENWRRNCRRLLILHVVSGCWVGGFIICVFSLIAVPVNPLDVVPSGFFTIWTALLTLFRLLYYFSIARKLRAGTESSGEALPPDIVQE